MEYIEKGLLGSKQGGLTIALITMPTLWPKGC